ncbi:hypothetical protein EHEL_100730 [Encephalitozoon hellem ATCC 50504]|uniref:Uncharacterized protein n=1 Tax=Encephalitozoon hellem TaxID=27973 RepID=A0A9Q9FAD8_ENCHE|nr:uncharacterized protein EHEL_100730 [Encephalitozoon hellem ATCC 50504]AFM99166.1 hypothetical protein EHEL_100730 [Encephalitozoon hellem ATCC 50504]UTX44152.1 hypothetical protein GPU96_10g19420 [Encephalitozoon hellem]WEL39642.1 hypothetical protein PFJ87_10g00900 [Encephalitozoon hellem]|eukprot:XP_003888147.1 hypothetical protein EHEL_100730 [Encephalitozoon hellem ATCC 50504]
MIHDEKTLLKALEHKSTEERELFSSMCSVLGLQYFSEESSVLSHTFASPSFVIDISESSARITFVDESFSRCFRYVEFLLSQHLEKSKMVDFYFYLRMFVRMETGHGGILEKDTTDICHCVFDGKYCINPSFKDVVVASADGIYNIYRHRFEYHLYTKEFILPIPTNALPEDEGCTSLVGENANGREVNARVSLNLARYFGPEAFSREVFRALPPGDFYWKGAVGKYSEVLVQKDLAVYADGGLHRDASFLMKLGKNLDFCFNFLGD